MKRVLKPGGIIASRELIVASSFSGAGRREYGACLGSRVNV